MPTNSFAPGFSNSRDDMILGGENAPNGFFNGTEGDDTIFGTEGETNTIFGNGGNDSLVGSDFQDPNAPPFGGVGREGQGGDFIRGGRGDDTIIGGGGDDMLQGPDGALVNGGNNLIEGGDGNDFLRGGDGIDTINGGAGFDRISFLGALDAYTQGVDVDLRTQTVLNDGFGNQDIISGIESISAGTFFADRVFGDDGMNFLSGSDNDTLMGFGGDDRFQVNGAPGLIDGGDGNDQITISTFRSLPGGNFEEGMERVIVDLAAGRVINNGFGESYDALNFEIVFASGAAGADLFGDDGANALTTTGFASDSLDGRGGDDTLDGGSDLFEQGTEAPVNNDSVVGGDGNDSLAGGGFEFAPAIFFTFNPDPGPGEPFQMEALFLPNSGDNTIDGGAGDDFAQGGMGNDSLIGGDGNDTLTADFVDFESFEFEGETVVPNMGDDTLIGGAGADVLTGGGGADLFVYLTASDSTTDNADFIAGFETGIDIIDVSAFQIAAPTLTQVGDFIELTDSSAGSDLRIVVEGDLQFTDIIFAPTTVSGGDSDDVIEGSLGSDRIDAGLGNDTIRGNQGDDVIFGNGGDDVINGGIGDDFVVAGAGADQLFGGDGDDILGGNGGDDTIAAGAGNDAVIGGDGNDSIIASDGDDAVGGGAGDDFIGLGNGNDFAIAGTGDDTVIGNSGDDLVGGNGGADMIDGGAGADTLLGGAGDDVLNGNGGDDALRGGTGADSVTGGAGADRFFIFNADESAVGAEDSILDFSGADGDTIDLRGLNNEVGGGGSLSFAGNAFSGVAGQVIVTGDGQLQVDLDGDSLADVAANVTADAPLMAADILI